jgi:hypothetical protein
VAVRLRRFLRLTTAVAAFAAASSADAAALVASDLTDIVQSDEDEVPRSSVRQLAVGGIRNQAFRIPKIKECIKPPRSLCERLSSETPGAIDSFSNFQNSSFDWYPSSPAELQNNLRTIQGDGVLARPIDLFRDETSRANLIHPSNLDLGFAQGVSSFLTPNGFRFECEFLVSGDERGRAKGESPKE